MKRSQNVNPGSGHHARAPRLRKVKAVPSIALKRWLATASCAQRYSLAHRAKITRNYLSKLANGYRRPSPALAEALVKASQSIVNIEPLKMSDLRDVYYEGQAWTS